MSYQALYRVYRPQTFSALVGQETISKTLINALKSNRLAHAYLFCGPRGTGKTSTSKILAKAVNCLAPEDGEPCNECEVCRAINEDRFLDVVEIDAASNRGIDEIRNIREQVRFAPSMGKRKVYIIDEVHMLTTEAFNALLKTLEEPPAHVLFILATTDPQKVPKTVLSRTQRFDFHKIGTGVLKNHLHKIAEEETIDISDDAITLIARSATGGMRDAISLLDQTIAFAGHTIAKDDVVQMIGGLDDKQLYALMDALIENNYTALFEIVEAVLNNGTDTTAFVRMIIDHLRHLLLARVHHIQAEVVDTEALKVQASQLPIGKIEAMMRKMAEAERDMRLAPDTELVLELALVEMMLLLHAPTEIAAPVSVATSAATVARPISVEKKALTAIPAVSEPKAEDTSTTTQEDDDPAKITAHWQDILADVKNISPRIHAFLIPAKIMNFENHTLELRFPEDYGFHRQQMTDESNAEILKNAIAHYYNGLVKLNCSIEQTPPPPPPPKIDLVEGARHVFGDDVPIIVMDEE